MSRPPPAGALGGSADEIETQFYEALQRADLDRLMSLWADDDEIVCVHPGGARVVGAGAIRASFAAIFANGAIPVQPEGVHRLQWHGGALHHLLERIEVVTSEGSQVAYVVASNVYVKTAQGWRIAAHHASPGLADGPSMLADAPSTLH
ncbi:MAG: YybH family protein [Rubrivivax sp.]|jgi:ketosteroid isomerase-like protein|nr:nuclear transport factor 2 family protein [Rubrivivax sp.]